ncbi:hypothetical protein [Actinocrispum wychmicini]|uniref:Uncharacterized protein n=1 Tax=Actinocrispum wychmicini TaxID=1213861 RepID=A0A4R2JIG9_9PSEU|nr:hypothetical protein [Actinocrispum wychmicini]TCO59711.1 hypothetical protein EV192_104554 [Actinocrispum wychmicini]
MKITDPVGGKWTVGRQVGAWPRLSRAMWALEVMPSGLGNDPISAVIAIPFFALALILLALALVELALLLVAWPVALLLRAVKVIGSRVVVVNTAKPVGVWEKTGKVRLRQDRFSTTVLEVETMAGSVRLRDAIAEHVRQGGDVMDPVVGQWLTAERGKVVSRRTKPDPEPVKPKTEPA